VRIQVLLKLSQDVSTADWFKFGILILSTIAYLLALT
jgi:hypothetical protein